jgi:histidinol phosphatase-like enzyme
MLEQAFRDFPQANGENSIMIGDSLHDIEAGSKMGMATALIADESVRRRAGAREATAQATVSAISLQEFVKTYFAVEEN